MRDEYSHTAAFYDAIYSDGGVRHPGDIAFYFQEAVTANGPILEIGCGTGRVGAPIALAGLPYHGLDLSGSMLDEFRSKLIGTAYHDTPLHHSSMTDFNLAERFDLVISPFRAMAHLLTVEDQLACLACVLEHLLPGGRFIFDLFSPRFDLLAKNMRPRPHELDCETVDLRTGDTLRRYVSSLVNLRHQVFEFSPRVEITRADGSIDIYEESFHQRYYFRYEVEHLLARGGFRVEALYGGFEREPFDYISGEMIWVAVAE